MIEKYVYLWCRSFEVRRFLTRTRHARTVQRDLLLGKLRRHADSDFGRAHGFGEIHSIDEYRRRVPVSDYEYFRPYIDRVRDGDTGALFGTGTRILMMAMTSGTTNQSKYLPVTQEFFDQYRRGWNLWALKTYSDHPDLVRKKTLKLGSNWCQTKTSAGIPCGNISGLVAETAPWIARSRFVLPSGVYGIDDPAVKHTVALRLALASRRVGMIGTANPSTLIEFARLADAQCEPLIKAIADGTVPEGIQLPPPVAERLAPALRRRDARRAAELEAVVERSGHLYLKDVWPLSVLAVWTGGSVGVYLPRLKDYYGEPAIRDHGLSASEARMTIPFEDGSPAGLLEYDHHFFEFLSIEDEGQAEPNVRLAHELEEGSSYYILLTTSGGLYRYNIHDVVKCVGYEGQAPWLVFLNKGAHFSSITGEKLSEHQVVAAVSASLRRLDTRLEHFTLAPVMRDRPGYVLCVEEGEAATADDRLAPLIDDHLQEQNGEYADKRRSGRILPVTVRQIPQGSWQRFRQQQTAARGNLEEYKHPCLVQDLGFVDRLLGIAGVAKLQERCGDGQRFV